MVETILIATFYSFQPFVAAAHSFSPSKMIVIIAEDSLKNEKVSQDLDKVRDVYGKIATVEMVKVKGSDLLAIASKTVELIEANKDKRIVVNVSGGWKLLAQGVLYGCYARKDLIDRIVCNNLENNSIVELPKLTFGLSSVKRELLEEISKRGDKSISKIANKLDKTRGMIYQHLKELKENGYVDEKFYITDAGRMALI
ncbi:CRISPR locus-related DNA-binding protein [Candidatus Micrarchaeota archaeon]|nr:CRISPR locus-related DNA-binding protein [Candidatus Micrarchaeota archaeon]